MGLQEARENIKFPEKLISDFAFWQDQKNKNSYSLKELVYFVENVAEIKDLPVEGLEEYQKLPEIAAMDNLRFRNELIRSLQKNTLIKSPLKSLEEELDYGDLKKYFN